MLSPEVGFTSNDVQCKLAVFCNVMCEADNASLVQVPNSSSSAYNLNTTYKHIYSLYIGAVILIMWCFVTLVIKRSLDYVISYFCITVQDNESVTLSAFITKDFHH